MTVMLDELSKYTLELFELQGLDRVVPYRSHILYPRRKLLISRCLQSDPQA